MTKDEMNAIAEIIAEDNAEALFDAYIQNLPEEKRLEAAIFALSLFFPPSLRQNPQSAEN